MLLQIIPTGPGDRKGFLSKLGGLFTGESGPVGARAMESRGAQQANEDVLRNPKVLEAVEGFIRYGFAPLDTPEKRLAVSKWSANPNASYEDMPPGAMWVELPAGFVPGIGDLQAWRDVYRDFKNGEVSGWTLVDAVSTIPGVLGASGFLVGMMRHGDEFAKMGRIWQDVERLRRAGMGGEELLQNLTKLGHTEDEARRVVGLGVEAADEMIGAAKPGETVIGARGAEPPKPRVVDDDLTPEEAAEWAIRHEDEMRWKGLDEGSMPSGRLNAPRDKVSASKKAMDMWSWGLSRDQIVQKLKDMGYTDDAARAYLPPVDAAPPTSKVSARKKALDMESWGWDRAQIEQGLKDLGYTDDAARAYLPPVDSPGTGGVERRATPRGELDDLTIERAARMAEEWGVPLERQGAEPAHWEAVRRAARGEGGDIDLDRMQEIQDGMGRRGQSYDEVALAPQYRVRRFAQTDADTFFNAVQEAEKRNPRVKSFHTERNLDDWKELEAQGAKFFVNETGDIGGAVLPDGDMVNLFNFADPAVGKGVAAEVLMPELIKAGGRKADWFDSRLNDLYAPYMDHVDRYAYDPQYGSDVTRQAEYAQYPGGVHPETGEQMADVVQGEVKPEVLQRLGVEEPEGGWRGAKAAHERKVTDFRMREALGFDPADVIDVSGDINSKNMQSLGFGRTKELKAWLEAQGALEEGSNFSLLYDRYLSQLSPQQANFIQSRPLPEQFLETLRFARQLPEEDIASIVAMGHRGKGWYEATAKSLAQVFGEDAPQMAALIAALSPNTSVDTNVRMAVDLWTEWTLAGRPRGQEEIQDLFELVRYNKGENTYRMSLQEVAERGGKGAHGVETNAINEVVRVLERENPVEFYSDPANWRRQQVIDTVGGRKVPIEPLSGPKTSNFFQNMMEEFRVFTNDTHMNRLNAMKENLWGSRGAQEAGYTGAVRHLNEQLGIGEDLLLQAGHGQELGWGPGRQLNLDAKAAQGGSVEEHLFPGGGPLDVERYRAAQQGAAEAGDIADFLREEENVRNLSQAVGPGGAAVDPTRATAHRTGMGPHGQAMDEYAMSPRGQEGLRRIARRMDMSNRGDYLMGMGGLMAGGAVARQGGLFAPSTEEDPALLRGRGLLGI